MPRHDGQSSLRKKKRKWKPPTQRGWKTRAAHGDTVMVERKA